MDDICYGFFAALSCPHRGQCPKAHNLMDLAAPECWVVFRSRNVFVAQHLAPHLQHVDRLYFLPNRGSLMRCQSAQAACNLVEQYCDYCSPILLSHYLTELGRRRSNSGIIPLGSPPIATEAESSLPTIDIADFSSSSNAGCDVSTDHSLSVIRSTPFTIESCMPTLEEQLTDWMVMPKASQHSISKELAMYETDTIRQLASEFLTGHSFSTESEGSGAGQSGSDHVEENVEFATEATGSHPCEVGMKPAKKPRDSISQRMWSKLDKKNCSHQVLHFLKENPTLRANYTAGWGALHEIWGVGPADFDATVLLYLYTKSLEQQEQILLTFAAIGITSLQNLSAYLSCLIREHETTSQVCMYFLADMCDHPGCSYVHSTGTPGWNLLHEKWGYTYKDFDYPVLNYLAKKPFDQQDAILANFAALGLGDVKNLSAFLSSVIHKMEKNKPLKPVMPVPDSNDGCSASSSSRGHGPHHSTRPVATIGSMINSPPKVLPGLRAFAASAHTPPSTDSPVSPQHLQWMAHIPGASAL